MLHHEGLPIARGLGIGQTQGQNRQPGQPGVLVHESAPHEHPLPRGHYLPTATDAGLPNRVIRFSTLHAIVWSGSAGGVDGVGAPRYSSFRWSQHLFGLGRNE